MLSKLVFLTVSLNFCLANAALLFWSNQKLDINPLAPFDDGDLESLVQKLDNPKLFKFKVQLKDGNQISKLENVREVLKGYNSAYNPNGNIGTADAVELEVSEECHGIDTTKISKVLSEVDDKTNFIAVIDVFSNRQKRDVEQAVEQAEPTVAARAETNNSSSVFYTAINANTNKNALVYSSKFLVLNVTDGDKYTTYSLGQAISDTSTFDNRLNVQVNGIKKDGTTEKIWLRFNFTTAGGYWYLPNLKVEIGKTELLNAKTQISARNGFSYHCGSRATIFRSSETKTTLTIYDFQVQVNATNPKFNDAYDCVGFTSIPIWSGIFITAILGIMMVVAILAMMDIRTMDRFDDHKTKNLAINVIE